MLEVTELATLHTFKIIFDNVSRTYPKENMKWYMFLSYIICQFFPLLPVKAYGHHTRFGHFGEEKNT